MTADTPKKPEAKITSRKDLYRGFFTVEELTIEADKHAGGTQTLVRENFERGHAVGVLAYDPKSDQVLLVNEMRPGMLAGGDYPFNDSLIAGMIDAGETTLQAASREGEEETGQHLQNLKVLHDGAFISPGGTSERLGLVYGEFDASTAGGVHGEAGEGEDIKSVLISADEFIARSKDGRIKDLKSLTLAFWFAAHRDELKDENAVAPAPAAAPGKSTKPQAKIVDRVSLYEGAFTIEALTIEMDKHEGGTQTLKRLNFDRGNSVAMLGYDAARDEVVLVNEFRAGALAAGANAYNDAVPAAILKDGENATTAAVKQMQRKTGLDFTGAQVIHNGVYSSSGGSSEKIALVVGAVDASKAGGIHGDPTKQDDILTVVMKADDFIDRAEKGQLTDMKTMAMAFWLANNRAALQKKAADAAAPHKNVGKDAASRRIAGLG